MKYFWVYGLLIMAFYACSDDDSQGSTEEQSFIETYLDENGIDYSVTQEGVYRYAINENSSGSASGNVYGIHYTLTDLRTGSAISSQTSGDLLQMRVGGNAIFPVGLDIGLQGIRTGETFGLIIPGSLGFQNYPATGVPDNAILHFEIEVISRQSVSQINSAEVTAIEAYINDQNLNDTNTHPVDPVVTLGGGTYYKRRSVGEGAFNSGDSLTISYTATTLSGNAVDNLSGFKFAFGSGDLIGGLETGISEMEQGEQATFIIPSANAYGGSVSVIPPSATDDLIDQRVIPKYAERVAPYEVLIFDVTLQTVH